MKQLRPIANQEYISFNGDDLIIIDKIDNLPDNIAYYSEYVLVLICTRGKMQIEYDGQSITVHENELFLGVPGSILSDYMISPNFDCKLLAVRPTEVLASRDMHGRIMGSMPHIKAHPVACLSDGDCEMVFGYYKLLCGCIQQEQHRYYKGEVRVLLNAFLLQVVGIMDRSCNEPEVESTIHGTQIVEKFVRMVSEDCGRNRFVGYYADQLNITPKYLSTLVKSSLGRTPTDIITVVTMKEIERHLRFGYESIKEICHAMNFPNSSFFGKYFKHHSGMTPNEYRKKYHK